MLKLSVLFGLVCISAAGVLTGGFAEESLSLSEAGALDLLLDDDLTNSDASLLLKSGRRRSQKRGLRRALRNIDKGKRAALKHMNREIKSAKKRNLEEKEHYMKLGRDYVKNYMNEAKDYVRHGMANAYVEADAENLTEEVRNR